MCNLDGVENESHFQFSCAPLQLEHSSFYVDCISNIGEFMLMDDTAKIDMLLSPDYIKKFGRYVEMVLRK